MGKPEALARKDVSMTRAFALVAIGGALGAMSRFAVTLIAARLFGKGFPWGTLAVNVAGCFVIGVIMRLVLKLETSEDSAYSEVSLLQHGVAIGFLGGLTTFSTFSADTLFAFDNGRPGIAIANIIANLALCLGAVWAGMATARIAMPS